LVAELGRHGRLKQREVVEAEIGDTDMAHLAGGDQIIERLAGFVVIHERIGPVNEQEIDAVGRHVLQRMLHRGQNVGA
jgi:hypothetical protein